MHYSSHGYCGHVLYLAFPLGLYYKLYVINYLSYSPNKYIKESLDLFCTDIFSTIMCSYMQWNQNLVCKPIFFIIIIVIIILHKFR